MVQGIGSLEKRKPYTTRPVDHGQDWSHDNHRTDWLDQGSGKRMWTDLL